MADNNNDNNHNISEQGSDRFLAVINAAIHTPNLYLPLIYPHFYHFGKQEWMQNRPCKLFASLPCYTRLKEMKDAARKSDDTKVNIDRFETHLANIIAELNEDELQLKDENGTTILDYLIEQGWVDFISDDVWKNLPPEQWIEQQRTPYGSFKELRCYKYFTRNRYYNFERDLPQTFYDFMTVDRLINTAVNNFQSQTHFERMAHFEILHKLPREVLQGIPDSFWKKYLGKANNRSNFTCAKAVDELFLQSPAQANSLPTKILCHVDFDVITKIYVALNSASQTSYATRTANIAEKFFHYRRGRQIVAAVYHRFGALGLMQLLESMRPEFHDKDKNAVAFAQQLIIRTLLSSPKPRL